MERIKYHVVITVVWTSLLWLDKEVKHSFTHSMPGYVLDAEDIAKNKPEKVPALLKKK